MANGLKESPAVHDAQDIPTEVLPTVNQIIEAVDDAYSRLNTLLSRPGLDLDAPAQDGAWNRRRLLSHIIGALQRVPVHAAYYLSSTYSPDDTYVPIQVHDDYWIPEWETAPIEAFRAAVRAAYLGNLHFVAELHPELLARTAHTPFGVWTLADLLMVSYESHINHSHVSQLET
jgi:hypothetical protein